MFFFPDEEYKPPDFQSSQASQLTMNRPVHRVAKETSLFDLCGMTQDPIQEDSNKANYEDSDSIIHDPGPERTKKKPVKSFIPPSRKTGSPGNSFSNRPLIRKPGFVSSGQSGTPTHNSQMPVLPLYKDDAFTPRPVATPQGNHMIRCVEELEEEYRQIFHFDHFNVIQSQVFDEVYFTDKPLVISAPTGSGKTAIFELAIIRLLMKIRNCVHRSFKVVYMAPIKALCSERYADWNSKFSPFGLSCKELTGDTEIEDFYELQDVNIIFTTPEKWDSMTRRWRDNSSIVQMLCLFLIDEIHILNDRTRGATVEAVISRMKTIRSSRSSNHANNPGPALRFIALSATIPNIKDVAEWLGDQDPAIYFKIDDSFRPVKLRKVVLGFPYDEKKNSEFQFDMSLSYKLAGIISTYSDDKPTLIFCSTRKGAMQAADILAKDTRGRYRDHRNSKTLQKYSNMVKDGKLRDLLVKGIAFHHAGMDMQDRKHIEEIFTGGKLMVLVATSTLCMGVNLPAHLVIVKSTQHYNMGVYEDYTDSQVLQMIGRAGRPQFDTSATAVIMTKNSCKQRYESLLDGTQFIESSLHANLIEHLNAEIVLHTINDISIALEWIRCTFLYIRVMKNPKHYGMPAGMSKQQTEKKLQDLCLQNLKKLNDLKLVCMDEEMFDVKPTELGRLMARYCIAFETMKKFCTLSNVESIADMLSILASSKEFTDVQLRVNEKKSLNMLNKDKNRQTIRYPMKGKITNREMKVNCLIQAQLGSLLIHDFALLQDLARIFRIAQRLTRCLVEVLWLTDSYKMLLIGVNLCKSIAARMWNDSNFVSRQLDGIGPSLSTALVNAGITSFEKIEATNPRELEMIVNRHPPFGNQVREAVGHLPKYELTIEQIRKYKPLVAEILLHVKIQNKDQLTEKQTTSPFHTCILLVADDADNVVVKRKISDSILLKSDGFTKKIEVKKSTAGPNIHIHYISQHWVGLDVNSVYTPHFLADSSLTHITTNTTRNLNATNTRNAIDDTGAPVTQECHHTCQNKQRCGHKCCQVGVTRKRSQKQEKPTPCSKAKAGRFSCYMSTLKEKVNQFPQTPSRQRTSLQTTPSPWYNYGTPNITEEAVDQCSNSGGLRKRLPVRNLDSCYDSPHKMAATSLNNRYQRSALASNDRTYQRSTMRPEDKVYQPNSSPSHSKCQSSTAPACYNYPPDGTCTSSYNKSPLVSTMHLDGSSHQPNPSPSSDRYQPSAHGTLFCDKYQPSTLEDWAHLESHQKRQLAGEITAQDFSDFQQEDDECREIEAPSYHDYCEEEWTDLCDPPPEEDYVIYCPEPLSKFEQKEYVQKPSWDKHNNSSYHRYGQVVAWSKEPQTSPSDKISNVKENTFRKPSVQSPNRVGDKKAPSLGLWQSEPDQSVSAAGSGFLDQFDSIFDGIF